MAPGKDFNKAAVWLPGARVNNVKVQLWPGQQQPQGNRDKNDIMKRKEYVRKAYYYTCIYKVYCNIRIYKLCYCICI